MYFWNGCPPFHIPFPPKKKTMFRGYIYIYMRQLVNLSICLSVCKVLFYPCLWSQQALDQFCSYFRDRINIEQRHAYYILVTVHWVFIELLPFDEIFTGNSRFILCKKKQFLGKKLFSDNSRWTASECYGTCIYCYGFKMHFKWKISTIQGRKHCEKRRNCLLQAVSHFSHDVFHSYISLVHQNAALCGNWLKLSCWEILWNLFISL